MTSIYQRAMGPQFDRLHPQVRRLFGFNGSDNVCAIGQGVMERVWIGSPHVRPFLRMGERRRILFAHEARDVPFAMTNYAYLDRFGRETVSWNRTFVCDPPRQFDETMIYSQRRGCVMVYAGTHQHLAVELRLHAGDHGDLLMRTGTQRLLEWPVRIRFPRILSGTGDILLRYDDAARRFHIDVRIANLIFGPIFGYHGWVDWDLRPCPPDQIPAAARPIREEWRE